MDASYFAVWVLFLVTVAAATFIIFMPGKRRKPKPWSRGSHEADHHGGTLSRLLWRPDRGQQEQDSPAAASNIVVFSHHAGGSMGGEIESLCIGGRRRATNR